MRVLLSSALAEAGYSVTAVGSGGALLAELRSAVAYGLSEPPDFVVSDVRMPGWSGLEVLAIAQMLDVELPFVLITAFGDQETHKIARALGAIAVLNKPFDLDELVATVRFHLDDGGDD
jgi:DNA-binding response OmpR family regulator